MYSGLVLPLVSLTRSPWKGSAATAESAAAYAAVSVAAPAGPVSRKWSYGPGQDATVLPMLQQLNPARSRHWKLLGPAVDAVALTGSGSRYRDDRYPYRIFPQIYHIFSQDAGFYRKLHRMPLENPRVLQI